MATYVEIASVTVGSGGTSAITFSSIPSTYTDLKVSLSLRGVAAVAAEAIILAINGSSSSFTGKYVYGNGSSALSGNDTTIVGYTDAASNTASTFGSCDIYIPNYAGSAYKSISSDSVSENNATYAIAILFATLWSNGAAINQLTFTGGSGNWAQYSTATLYGIKKD